MRKFHGLEKLRTNQEKLVSVYRLEKLLTIDLAHSQMIIYCRYGDELPLMQGILSIAN